MPRFGSLLALESIDFQAPPTALGAATFGSTASAGWYSGAVGGSSLPSVNRTGRTQFRLRFALDDNNDALVNNHGVPETLARRQTWANNVQDWEASDDNTNLVFLTDSKLGPFANRATRIYKCPADREPGPNGPRIRSMSMNYWLGAEDGKDLFGGSGPGWRPRPTWRRSPRGAKRKPAARAAGIQPIDSVFSDVGDMEGLKQNVLRSKALGFDGMGCIHPRQIRVIHDNFAPSEEEVEKAKRIVFAFHEAQSRGLGVVSLGTKMIDPPVVKRALNTINLALKTGRLNENWRETYEKV